MAEWLRALDALPEDLGLDPNPGRAANCDSSSRELNALF